MEGGLGAEALGNFCNFKLTRFYGYFSQKFKAITYQLKAFKISLKVCLSLSHTRTR